MTSLYCPAYPKYLAETILPPPTPCECRECAEDAPRSVQMHTGASSAYVPTLSRPCLCFWTLPYSVVFSIIAWFFHLSSGRKFRPVHIAIPRTGVEPTWGLNRTYAVFSRLSSEVISLVQPLTANRQHEEEVKRIISPSLIFSFILSYERTKVKSKVFVSEKLCVKLLPILSSATFRISLGHRCILNLPYVLRIRVLLCRSPSHQPSAWDHSLRCRWLGESSPLDSLLSFGQSLHHWSISHRG